MARAHFGWVGKRGETDLEDEQTDILDLWANQVRNSTPEAIGIAFVLLECGCLKGGPFDANGDQAGPVAHREQVTDGEIKRCETCARDGGAMERVSKSFLLFFQPCSLSREEKDRIGAKIFCTSPNGGKED